MYKKPKWWTSLTEERKIRKAIREDKWELEWHNISFYGKLSENFIREFQDKVSWYEVCEHQEMSEDFIREFQDKVNWAALSHKCLFSESFLREFKNKVDWNLICNNNKIYNRKFSKEFLKDMKEYIKKKHD